MKLELPGRQLCDSRETSTIPNTNCARYGACSLFILVLESFALLWKWRKASPTSR